jgi:uncharacterized protein with HEPN domain
MPKLPVEYLRHILDECDYIISVVTPDLTMDDLLKDETLKRAVIRSLEIIGEATKQISLEVKVEWQQVPWKNLAGLRDKLIHNYMGVNYLIVWDVVKNKVPLLREQIARIIKKEQNRGQ